MNKLLALALLFSINLFAQKDFQERSLITEIKSATVFLEGAQLFREGGMNLTKGMYELKMESLSALMDPNSIIVKAKGDLKIISVQHQFDYLEQKVNSKKVDSLQALIDQVEDQLRIKSNRSNVLSQKEALISSNRNLGTATVSSTQLMQMLNLYEKELSAIKEEQSMVNLKIGELRTRQAKLRNQLRGLEGKGQEIKSNILLKVEVIQSTNAKFEISYFAEGAGWYPKYRLNVKDITEPIALEYQAEVFQQTGEDWINVKLKFSNAQPNQNQEAPNLDTWYLDYARFTRLEDLAANFQGNTQVKGKVVAANNGEPLPGVNVLVVGTSVGTNTDSQGNYSITMPRGAAELQFAYIGMRKQVAQVNSPVLNIQLQEDVQQLSEVVVNAYGRSSAKRKAESSIQNSLAGNVAGVQVRDAERMTSTIVKKQTNVEFEVDEPYTIRSGNPQMFIDLKEYTVKANYNYVAIPKLDKSAYLVAAITNWGQYNLMEGEAKLFFEGAFVGTTILNANAAVDTLRLSLGKDKGIVIEREKIDNFSSRSFIGANQTNKVGYQIKVRNTKSQAVVLNLYDQVPVSVREQIEISVENTSKAKYTKKSGELKWELTLSPNQSLTKEFVYEVKYPKGEKVILE